MVLFLCLHRCDIPADIHSMQQRLDLILTWIFENPNAVIEEAERIETERLQQEERLREAELCRQEEIERLRQQSDQSSAAQDFLSSIAVRTFLFTDSQRTGLPLYKCY